MKDQNEKLANVIVNHSCKIKFGDKVLVSCFGEADEFVEVLVEKIFQKGAFPFVEKSDYAIEKLFWRFFSRDMCCLRAKYDSFRMSDMDVYIGIRASQNMFENSDVENEKLSQFNLCYQKPVHFDLRIPKTRWLVLKYPTPAMAQAAKMSSDAFENYYFSVCTLNYEKMSKAMDELQKMLAQTKHVRIVAKNTDISFAKVGIGAVKCAGEMNLPDGEVYTAPERTSVHGFITFNIPSVFDGVEFHNIRFDVKNGRIVKASCDENQEKLFSILNTDDGANYFGEFAIGVNPLITTYIGDILFDEKMTGSIHLTPGACYKDAWNGNESAIHWDLVLSQTPEYGGGEIWFDDILVRKNGEFICPNLLDLNSNNLI